MKKTITLSFLLLFMGQESWSGGDFWDQYTWKNRVILVFTPSVQDPLFQAQQKIFEEKAPGLRDRDVVILTLVRGEGISSTETSLSPQLISRLYQQFGVSKTDFTIILRGKDGGEKLRRTSEVLSSEELFSVIDAMPMRQREMREAM